MIQGDLASGSMIIAFIIREYVIQFAAVILGTFLMGWKDMLSIGGIHATNMVVLYIIKISVSLYS